jgi:hypothetical protein
LGVDSPDTREFRQVEPISHYHVLEAKQAQDAGTATGRTLQDLTGGLMGDGTRGKIDNLMREVFDGPNGRRNKGLALLGGLAIGGAIAYNTLSNTEPVVPLSAQYDQSGMQASPQAAPSYGGGMPHSALPPIQEDASNAQVHISASGNNMKKEDLAPLVHQGMRQSNYNGGASNMNVNYQDNTERLSRNWYRDKVDQYT